MSIIKHMMWFIIGIKLAFGQEGFVPNQQDAQQENVHPKEQEDVGAPEPAQDVNMIHMITSKKKKSIGIGPGEPQGVGTTCGDSYSGTVDLNGIADDEHFNIDTNHICEQNAIWEELIPSSECLHLYNVSHDILMRMKGVAVADLSSLTNAFNDDLIKQGRLYSVEQIYPILNNFGEYDDMHTMAKRLEHEFRRYVILSLLMNNEISAPAGPVDMYWHFFILHTRHYFDFSRNLWGNEFGEMKYRHHYPANDQTRPTMRNAYTNTRQVLIQCYPQFTPCAEGDCIWKY
eukprot:345421_1